MISGSTGVQPRASGTPFLHSTTELPNHMSISLMIYLQIPISDYTAIHLHLSMGQTSILHKQKALTKVSLLVCLYRVFRLFKYCSLGHTTDATNFLTPVLMQLFFPKPVTIFFFFTHIRGDRRNKVSLHKVA